MSSTLLPFDLESDIIKSDFGAGGLMKDDSKKVAETVAAEQKLH